MMETQSQEPVLPRISPTSTKETPFNAEEQKMIRQARAYIGSVGKWSRFFFVLTVIMVVLTSLLGITFLVLSPIYRVLQNTEVPLWYISVLYFASTAIQVVLAIFLYRLMHAAELVQSSDDNQAVVSFLLCNKKLWTFLGILTIFMLSTMVLLWVVVWLVGFIGSL